MLKAKEYTERYATGSEENTLEGENGVEASLPDELDYTLDAGPVGK